jgi:hypothetical protein
MIEKKDGEVERLKYERQRERKKKKMEKERERIERNSDRG